MNRMRSSRRLLLLVLPLIFSAPGCEGADADEEIADVRPDSPAGADTAAAGSGAPQESPPVTLVDSTIPPAVAGEDGWMYRQSAAADLDGDGTGERVVLTARVELIRNRPVWDDGQPWQVYVEEDGGERTYLYARFVQLGTVTIRIGLPEAGKPASVILLEHLPDRISLHELEYRGPGHVQPVQRFVRSLDPTGEVSTPSLP